MSFEAIVALANVLLIGLFLMISPKARDLLARTLLNSRSSRERPRQG
jgi:hypothetical protein